MAEDSILKGLQVDLTERLLADPYFSDIPVLSENLLDLENQVETAIAGIGAFAMIVTPTATVGRFKDAPGPYLGQINIVCRCHENVTVNRSSTGTGKTCAAIAEHALTIIHGYHPVNVVEQIVATDPSIAMVPDPNGLLVYDVMFQTNGGLAYTVPVLGDVTISVAGGMATLGNATQGAAIFYTVNNVGYPSPRSGIFYSAPFSAPAGTLIKAKAYLAGYNASPQASLRVT